MIHNDQEFKKVAIQSYKVHDCLHISEFASDARIAARICWLIDKDRKGDEICTKTLANHFIRLFNAFEVNGAIEMVRYKCLDENREKLEQLLSNLKKRKAL